MEAERCEVCLALRSLPESIDSTAHDFFLVGVVCGTLLVPTQYICAEHANRIHQAQAAALRRRVTS